MPRVEKVTEVMCFAIAILTPVFPVILLGLPVVLLVCYFTEDKVGSGDE